MSYSVASDRRKRECDESRKNYLDGIRLNPKCCNMDNYCKLIGNQQPSP